MKDEKKAQVCVCVRERYRERQRERERETVKPLHLKAERGPAGAPRVGVNGVINLRRRASLTPAGCLV